MVFACDIYAVFPGEDLGVRVEDTIVITETGCENLTPGLPRTVAEIEAFMKAGEKPGEVAATDGAFAERPSQAVGRQAQPARPPIVAPTITAPAGSQAIEQVAPGTRPAAAMVASFDGLGSGFEGPQGSAAVRNPSDNSLAVGPDHIVQTVNSRMAIFTKKGSQFRDTGRALYGPVPTNNVFRGFGGVCEATNNGDAVVRYDQLADRWLIVMPIFRRGAAPPRSARRVEGRAKPSYLSPPGRPGQPGRRCGAVPAAATRNAGLARASRSGRRAARCQPRPCRRRSEGAVLDVLRRQHGAGPVRPVLPLRVPAPAVSGLSAAGHLA